MKLQAWHPILGVFEAEIDDDSQLAKWLTWDLGGEISMRPSLDHYIGRPFEDVITNEDGESWEWGIRLEGGAVFKNKDKERTQAPNPKAFEGTGFLLVTYSELDTTMKFGTQAISGPTFTQEVVFTADAYTIADPDYTREDEIYPQRPEEFDDVLPPDPSADRVADGPEEPSDG